MKIITLMEDTVGKEGTLAEHGLSLYIETKYHKLLVDTGQSELTWENAKRLGVDLSKVDTIVISHGHYDHTGGLISYAKSFGNADIYMQKKGAGYYYHGDRYIGIDRQILNLPKLHLIEGDYAIDDELELFSDITGRKYWPKSNLELSEKIESRALQDHFQHEQCLVIKNGNEKILVSGCAHNGILNILERFETIYHAQPDRVISGFQMMKKTGYTEEEKEIIRNTAKQLQTYPTVFYTGHCTGREAFKMMKEVMGDQLFGIHSGDRIV